MTYQNPVIAGFHPDLDAVALGCEDHAGSPRTLARVDGRYLSTEVTGGFLGRTVGMFAVGGDASFDRFDDQEA